MLTAGAGAMTTDRVVISASTIISMATGHHAPPAAATAAVVTSGSGPPTSAPVVSRASAMPEKRSRVSNSSLESGLHPEHRSQANREPGHHRENDEQRLARLQQPEERERIDGGEQRTPKHDRPAAYVVRQASVQDAGDGAAQGSDDHGEQGRPLGDTELLVM